VLPFLLLEPAASARPLVEFVTAAVLTAAAGWALIFGTPERVPRGARLAPAFAYLLAVALLRDAGGAHTAGVGPVVLLPVVWVALYGTRAQLAAVVAGVAAVFLGPTLLLGGAAYPAIGWRLGILFTVVGGIIGSTVQRLVHDIRDQAAERAGLLTRLEVLAHRDELTGAANRRAWSEDLEQAMLHGARHAEPLCVAVLDIDRFKAINDGAGHDAGDALLRDTAAAWLQLLRPRDELARLGGDEFAVLLPDCPAPDAGGIIDRLRASLPAGVTCSVGITPWDGAEEAAPLMRRADAALYEAKRSGRDRVVVHAVEPARAAAA
jgi:diguanylate cyclase (GGDEF)-like protein